MADFGEVVIKEWEPHDLSNIDYLTVTFLVRHRIGIRRNEWSQEQEFVRHVEKERTEILRQEVRRIAAGVTHAVSVSDESTDCATGYCRCELCGEPIDQWDHYCRWCGAEVEK